MRIAFGTPRIWEDLSNRHREWIVAMAAATAYYATAQLAFAIGTLSDRIFAPFWPPNVILFCALLLSHRETWKLILCLTFLAHVLAELSVGMIFPQMLLAFATNSALAILNATVILRLVGGPPCLVICKGPLRF